MQVERERQIEQSRQIKTEESDAYSLFVYAVRSQVTRDYYLRRLRIFLNHISLLPGGDFGYKCRNCNTINRITLEDGELKKQEYSLINCKHMWVHK